jgi:hypothetical protein
MLVQIHRDLYEKKAYSSAWAASRPGALALLGNNTASPELPCWWQAGVGSSTHSLDFCFLAFLNMKIFLTCLSSHLLLRIQIPVRMPCVV